MGPDCTFQLVELVDSDLRRLGIVTVATVNLRDFATVRPRHVPSFITVPGLC